MLVPQQDTVSSGQRLQWMLLWGPLLMQMTRFMILIRHSLERQLACLQALEQSCRKSYT